MKKRISLLLAVVMVIALALLAIPFSTFADEIVYETDPEAVVAKVYTGSGASRVHYADIKLANVVSELLDDSTNANTTNVISKAARSNGGSAVEVDILANINLGANRIGFSANSKGTVINGGGYTIEGENTGGNRVTSARGLEAESVLTIKNLNIYCDTGSSCMQLYSNMSVSLEGCNLTSTTHYGVFDNNNGILTIDENTVIAGGQYGININANYEGQKAVVNINGGTVKKIGTANGAAIAITATLTSDRNTVYINEGSEILVEGKGYAIYCDSPCSPNVYINGATVKSVADSGASAAIFVGAGSPDIEIKNSTVHADAGYALHLGQNSKSGTPLASSAKVIIDNSTVSSSQSASGTVKIEGDATKSMAHTITAKNATNIISVETHALNMVAGATFTADNISITAETVTETMNGSAMAVNSSGTLSIKNSVVTSECTYAIQVGNGTATLEGSTFVTTGGDKTKRADAYLGAMTTGGTATVTATGCTFTGETYTDCCWPVRPGGKSVVTLENCTFNSTYYKYNETTGAPNAAAHAAGVVVAGGATAIIKGTVSGNADALRVRTDSVLTLDGVTSCSMNIGNHNAELGTINILNSTITGKFNAKVKTMLIENSSITVTGDNAVTFGGGELTIRNSHLTSTGAGGPCRIDAGTVTIIGGTITAASRAGGAIEAKGGSTVTVDGTVVSGGTGAGIGLQGNGTTVTVSGVTVLTTGSGMPLKIVAGAKNCTLIIKDGYFEGVNGNGVIYVDGATTKDDTKTQNVNITIYDGYFRALGNARALNAPGNAGVQGDITIYGGTFIATNTGGAVRPNDGGALAVKMYGGHVYNYQTDADRQPSGNGSQIVAVYLSGKYTAADGTTQVTSGVWNVAEIFAETVKVAEGDNKISLNAIDRSLWYTNSDITNTTLYYQKNSARLPLAPQAEKGAEVRIATGSDGIRFVSTIPTALEARLTSTVKGIDADSISYGTAIVPTHYITDNRLNTFSPVALETLGVTVLKIPATEKGTTVDEENGIITIRAAVIGMNETQKLLAYSAVPYVTYTVNGESVYLYGIYDYVNNSRTIPDVAERAICDVVSEEDRGLVNEDGDVYSNPVEIEGVTYYSIYSTSAYEKLKYYAALDGTADDYESLGEDDGTGTDDAASVASILG